MKVTKVLKCNCEEAFLAVEQSLALEISQKTKKKVRIKDLQKGFTYNTKMRASKKIVLDTKVIIKEFDRPHHYACDFINSEGINHISYEFQPVNEFQCLATYEETYDGAHTMNRFNYKAFGWLLSATKKKKIKRTFDMIQNYALQKRNGGEEVSEETEEETKTEA